jgi:HEAT repeat protein
MLINTSVTTQLESVREFFSSGASDSELKARAKNTSIQKLKEMLTSSDPGVRGFAAKIMGYKDDPSAVSVLIQSLNDNARFQDVKRNETSVSDISRAALVQILRRQISRKPEDLSLLLPFFAAAEQGTPVQREKVIEILGQIREPLVKQLLLGIPILGQIREPLLKQLLLGIPAEDNPELGKVSTEALAQIDSHTIANAFYENVRAGQIQFAFICAIIILLLLCGIAWRLRDQSNTGLILLSLAPLVLVGLFGAIVATDFSRGKVTGERIDLAIMNQDLVALKTMLYHDYVSYPGDSTVARHLLQSCDENVIHCLIALRSVQSTDDETAIKNTEAISQWILARCIASNLGTPDLEALLNSPDPQIRLVLASALGKLGVRNEQIIAALTHLAKDNAPQVRKTAEESIARVRGNPVWKK